MKKLVLSIIIFLATTFQAVAANHYFSQAGNDTTGDGSIGTPWKSLDKASTECGTDDTCYFNKGDTWDLTQAENQQDKYGYNVGLYINGHGVTISSYGTGAAPIFDGGSTTDLRSHILMESADGFVIDGLNIRNGYTNASCSSDANCHGVYLYNDTGGEIKNSTFTSVYNGAVVNSSCGISFHNNTCSTLAHDCVFFFIPGNCTANKNIVYQNTVNTVTYNGFDIVGSGDGSNASGVRVYQNYINAANNGIEMSRANSNEIFNNVITNCTTSDMLGGILVAIGANNNLIYNNTVYGCNYGLIIGQYTGSSCTEQGTGNVVKNNISSNSGTAEIHLCTDKSNVVSNNLYYKSTGAVLKADNATVTTANWTSTYEASAIYTDPLFVDSGGTLPAGLSIQSLSPAKDAGTDLSGTFTTDYNGVTRPRGSAWDRGAYEYLGDSFLFNGKLIGGAISY